MRRTHAFFLLSFLLAALAIILNPERLSAIGIMDTSLASENDLTRNTALATVVVARSAMGFAAALFLLLAIAAPRIEASSWFKRRLSEGSAFPHNYEISQRHLFNTSLVIAGTAIALAVTYLVAAEAVFDQETLDWINYEDGFLEWLSAAILIGSSILALVFARQMPTKSLKWMYFFLAFLFFVMFGEEISWGQRQIGFQTPEQLGSINVQNEVNLHNSFGYLFDHLFILCFFIWGCVVPALYWIDPIWRWFQSRLGLPFPSLGLALAMFVVSLFQPELTDRFIGDVPGLRVAELRETLSALCFLLLMWESRTLTAAKDDKRHTAFHQEQAS